MKYSLWEITDSDGNDCDKRCQIIPLPKDAAGSYIEKIQEKEGWELAGGDEDLIPTNKWIPGQELSEEEIVEICQKGGRCERWDHDGDECTCRDDCHWLDDELAERGMIYYRDFRFINESEDIAELESEVPSYQNVMVIDLEEAKGN